MAAKKPQGRKTTSKQAKSTTKPAPVRTDLDEAPPNRSDKRSLQEVGQIGHDGASGSFLVVGICASAGGLDALTKFFKATPADCNAAFILAPHLAPGHKSLMVELLAKCTTMSVSEACHGTPVQPNRVYVIPPNRCLAVAEGVLQVTEPENLRELQGTMDTFLASLAADAGERAVGIVLSGTGTHGTWGLKAIQASGGVTIAQDPETAEHRQMPQSAIEAGVVDFILGPEQMPTVLIKYAAHAYVSEAADAAIPGDAPDQVQQILALLRTHSKHDFRCYRRKMLARRIQRRMGLRHVDGMAEYLTLLRENPDEVSRLLKDLLIGVTAFFRDPESFQVLQQQVLSKLVADRDSDTPIRVWVPGCASGEEAYSVAMLLVEQFSLANKDCSFHVFATDLDNDSLQAARRGIYPDSIAGQVPPERLLRFFARQDEHHWQMNKQLRECVTFAVHNLISDPPFSKLDLISCRNVLIYLEPELQARVISLFHFALNEGGFLLLGPSETVTRQAGFFEPVSQKRRIYRKVGTSRRPVAEYPIVREMPQPPFGQRLAALPSAPADLRRLTEQVLLRKAPAAVLIDRHGHVLNYHGPTRQYLQNPSGAPTQDFIALALEGLKAKLRAAVSKALRDEQPVTVENARVKRDGAYHWARIAVEPVREPKCGDVLLLVTFDDVDRPTSASASGSPRGEVVTDAPSLVRQLEYELKASREDLQSTVQELSTANEELKAASEELMSMNEELQSSNEELETSKEELQSLNEELNTTNNELQEKVVELESANNDISNLLNSTAIGTLFLDRDLRIRLFTPTAQNLFNLIPSDVGRPIADITSRFAEDDLIADARHVLKTLAVAEKEVRTVDATGPAADRDAEEARCYSRRTLPYRTRDNRIAGVVVTFVDITERKRANDLVAAARLYAEAIVETIRDPLIVLDADFRVQTANRSFYESFEMTPEQTEGRLLYDLKNRDWDTPELQGLLEGVLSSRSYVADYVVRYDFEGIGRRVMQLSARTIPGAANRPDLILLAIEDITELTRVAEDLQALNETLEKRVAERTSELADKNEALRESEQLLRAIVETAADGIVTADEAGTIETFNSAAQRLFGYKPDEAIGQNVRILMPSPYHEEHDGYMVRYLRTGVSRVIGKGLEAVALRKDGSTFPVELALSEIDHCRRFTAVIRDVSFRKELERQVLEVSTEEQRRIGQDLHDGIGQELAGLGLVAEGLVEIFAADPSDPPLHKATWQKLRNSARRLSEGLGCTLEHVRELSAGLVPADIDTQGLQSVLKRLVSAMSDLHDTACDFQSDGAVDGIDSFTAIHIYRIAQGALANALKHSQATKIRILLTKTGDGPLVLEVADNGVGIANTQQAGEGIGLRIMEYRARLIGAKLRFESAQGCGTKVICSLAHKPCPVESRQE